MQKANEFRLECARHDDVPQLVRLMGSVVPDCAPHTVWELPWNWVNYHVIRDENNDIIAAGSLQDTEEGDVELRGIVVKPEWRGSGIATSLLEQLVRHAKSLNKRLVCITGKPDFFERFGFQQATYLWQHAWQRHRPDRKPSQRVAMLCYPQGTTHHVEQTLRS
ncbi:MAG: N-acetyltransferase [Deltaproteobacteria bacterium]|nr:MAG: N-acetyltransferase [Deltaproteobacteria bacterium]